MLSVTICFGWTYFLGGHYSYALLLGNGLGIFFIAYILFYIFKNDNIRFKYTITIFIFLNGLLLIILGTINYVYFINNRNLLFPISNVPKLVLVIIPTIGGISSATLFIPQFIKILKSKKTKNLNYLLILFFLAYILNIIIFWILFGINSKNWSLSIPPLIFCSISAIIQTCTIILKWRYEKEI